jgi:hypothetical protein
MRLSIVVGSKRMVVDDDSESGDKINDRGVVLHEPGNLGEFQLTCRLKSANLSRRRVWTSFLLKSTTCWRQSLDSLNVE